MHRRPDYKVKVKETYSVTEEDTIELVSMFLEYEHDLLCDDLDRHEISYKESQLDFIKEDIENTKKVMEAMDTILEYYKVP
jgi:hypothetical protein